MFNERLARENLALQAAREARRDAEDRAAQQAKQDAAAEANEAFSAVLSRPPLGTRVPAADAATLLARESRASRRRDAVREAFLHAWDGYSLYAWGHDEVRPVSNATNDSWGSWGATLVDGLDTAMLMGVGPEVLERARQHVANIQWNKRPEYYASFFEVTIRYLGGLLGAYELSREQTYLIKARELADALLPSFDSPSGLPRSQINPATGHAKNAAWAGGGQSILAEVASCQLELEYLSFHTGDPKYAGVARKVIEVLDEAEAESEVPGLLPTYIDPTSGKFSNSHYSLGSFGDSAYVRVLTLTAHPLQERGLAQLSCLFGLDACLMCVSLFLFELVCFILQEYLLKSWLLTDRRDQRSLRLFNRAMAAMEERMVKSFWASFIEDDDKPFHEEEALESASAVATTTSSGQAAGRRVTKRFAFIGELTGASSYKHVMEHLTCFVPGMLALAVASGADEGFKNERGWPQEANRIMAHQHERTDTPGRRVGAAGSSSDGEDAAAVSVASSAVATSDAAAAAGQLTAEELELRSSAARHTSVADALLNTCMAAYKLTATGLAPESWSFEPRDMPTEANRRAKVRAIQRTKREEYTRRGALPPSGLAAVQAGLEEDPANSNPNAAGEAIARLMERKMRRAGVHAGPDGLPMLRKPGQIVPVGVAGSGDDDDNNGRRGGKSSSAVLALSSLSDIDPDLDPSDPDTDGYGLRVVRVEHEADLLVSGSGFGADSGGGGGLFRIDQRKYVLRPETVESLFIAFRLTGEERFRDAAWDIFVNLQKNCRTPTAFSGIKDCDYGRGAATATDDADAKSAWSPRVHQRARVQGADGPANWRDSQESFFFAETLKYLYLIFSPTDVLPLDRFVFNTEAHPLGILVEHDRPAINTAAAAAAQQPAANELR
jgi:hypothetical protein